MKIQLDSPACYGRWDLFVPDRRAAARRAAMAKAAPLCAACPYRVECASQGLRVLRTIDDTDTIRAGVGMWEPGAAERLADIVRSETP